MESIFTILGVVFILMFIPGIYKFEKDFQEQINNELEFSTFHWILRIVMYSLYGFSVVFIICFFIL